MNSRTAGRNSLIDTALPWIFRNRTKAVLSRDRACDIEESQDAIEEKSPCPREAHVDPQQLSVALESSETRLVAALQNIKALEKNNRCLKRKALRLARLAAHARHSAYHDVLTGLPNRLHLADRFRQIKAQAQRHGWQVGFMMLDLNQFKRINDRFGHAVGDDLLRHVASCLLASTRRSDTVCRYGGDEFVIMLPEMRGHERMALLAEEIHARLATCYTVRGTSIEVATSIGIALYPMDGEELDGLLDRADILMYEAKTAR